MARNPTTRTRDERRDLLNSNVQALITRMLQERIENPPPPTPGDILGMGIRNLFAGAGETFVGLGNVPQWWQEFAGARLGIPPEAQRALIPGPEAVIGGILRGIGAPLSGLGTPPAPYEGLRSLADPRFLATAGARAIGGSLPFMAAGIGLGAALRGASPWVQALGAGAGMRALEGAVQADQVMREALAQGRTPEEAANAAGQVFAANLGLTGIDAAQFALSFLPIARQASTTLGRAAQVAGRVAGAAATEALEEGAQEVIQRWALGQPIALDPQMQQALALGGLLGGAFGAAGQVLQARAPELMRAPTPETQPTVTPAVSEPTPPPAVQVPQVEAEAGIPDVLRQFAGRRMTRFDIIRLPVEQQRAIRDALTQENIERLNITVAPAAREYLEARFSDEFAELVTAWENAGVPNEVIARALAATHRDSLRRRQRRLQRDGLIDIPMFQAGGWVRMPVETANFAQAQRAYVDAGRPRGIVDLSGIEEERPVFRPEPTPAPATQPSEGQPATAVQPQLFPGARLTVADVRQSLLQTGSARVGDHTLRIVPHPQASGRTPESYAVEWAMPDGTRRIQEGPPLTIEAAMDEIVRIARTLGVRGRTTATRSARPTPAPQAAPQPQVVGDIQSGQIVYDPRGNALEVIDASDPSMLTVRNERGTQFRIGRRVARTEPPPGVQAVQPTTPPAQPQTAMAAAETAAPAAPAVQPSPVEPVARGGTSSAITERGTEVQTEWAIVNARDLVTSHDTSLRPNPAFPQELQPRARERAASELQITRLVNELRPELLAESPLASQGAPIVGPDMIVESGNARTIALKRAYEQGAPSAERYRQWLAENAQRFGIDPQIIQQAEQPVLVRIRRTDVDRRQFVVEANEPPVAAMSATEQAMVDASRLTEDLIGLFAPDEEGNLMAPENRSFIFGFLNQVVAPGERGRILTEDGRLSQEGVARIRNAIFARAYGSAEALAELAESTDSNVRNITNAMVVAAPRMVQLREGIRRGQLFDLDPTPEIVAAMRKMAQLRAERVPVETYLQQAQLFADDLSPLARDFLQVFDANKRSSRQISRILMTYADLVEALGDPRQGTLFGERRIPDRASLLQAAIEKVAEGYDPTTRQASIFQPEPTGGAVAEEAPGRVAQAEGPGGETPSEAGPTTLGFPEQRRAVAHERPAPAAGEPARVVTRKEAIDFIEREFVMPVREGRLRNRRARGEFNLRTHVTRLRRAEDFRALTHEFGHFLSETLDLKPENYPELEPMGAALYPDADTALKREEGNAEFFYLYFSNPEQAKAAAPNYYADFEAMLEREPELKAKIRQAQQLFMAQFRQTGTAAIKAAIVREDAKERPFLTPIERFYTTWVDDLYPVFKVMKTILGEENIRSEWDVNLTRNPYVLGRLARGRFRKAQVLLTRGQFSPDTFERTGPSLQEILRPVAAQIEDFEAYLVAKRALELHERGINPGVRREDAEAAVRELESPEFQQAQQQLVAYQDNLIDHLIDAGVINQETADTFRVLNRDYVPFYRYFGEETVSGGLAGGRLRWGNLPQPVRAIRGSTRSIYSPLQSIIRNTITMIDIAERNRAARALVELAKDAKGIGWLIEPVPTPVQPNEVELARLRKDLLAAGIPAEVLKEADLQRIAVTFSPVKHARFKEARENILTVYRNGKPEFYQLHPELYRAMQFLDQPAYNWLFRLLSVPTQILRAGATLNIDFSPRNLARDQFSALMHRKYRFIPFVDPARAMFHAIRGNLGLADELYDRWVASGGAQSTMVSLNRDYLEQDLRRMIGERSARDRVVQIIRSPLTALEFISSVLEESTRLAQFRAGLRAEGQTPEGIRKAAYASREISVDFQRAGTYGRQANQIKAFFNAAIQGTDQMARLFRRDPVGYTIRALTYITLPSIALYLMNRDDPRYQELPQWRKDLFWVILGEDSMFFIPKPFEIGVLFGALPERILRWVEENDPEAFEGFADTLMETTMPVDLFNPLDWLPDAFTPILEVYANRSLFTDRPIVPRGEEDLQSWAQYGPNTSELAKALGRYTGTSPRQIEHLITGYGGGLARHALRFLDELAGAGGTQPIVRPFGGDPFVSAVSLDEFYQELEDLEQAQRTANELRRRGLQNTVEVNEARLRYLRRVRDNLASLRRLSRQILEDPTLPVDQKREMTDRINLRMVNLARMALGKPPIPESTPAVVGVAGP